MTHCRECSPIGQAIEALSRLELFSELCHKAFHFGQHAIAQLRAAKRLDYVIHAPLDEPLTYPTDENFERFLKSKVEPVQQFAQEETQKETPYLHSLLAIRLWSILETAVDDLVGQRLLRPECHQHPRLKKVKGHLFEFVSLDEDDKLEFLVESLKQELSSSLQVGIGRFEGLLDVVGFGGSVHEDVRFVLLELSQIRHAVVHRNGTADKKLLKQCPWLHYQKGDAIEITEDQYGAYLASSLIYLSELAKRHFADIECTTPEAILTTIEDGQRRLAAYRIRQSQASGDRKGDATCQPTRPVPVRPR